MIDRALTSASQQELQGTSSSASPAVSFEVNGAAVHSNAPPLTRLTDVLRDELGLTGTKVGCEAGDCGACTVLVDDQQICACMMPLGQVGGRRVVTVEGLAQSGRLNELQRAFLDHGAAQCGICTPGMLIAASDLLRRNASPTTEAVMDALGGVLCRCTGYQKIVEAVMSLGQSDGSEHETLNVSHVQPGAAVGARLARIDGPRKIDGTEVFGADEAPADALWMRVVRSPHASARFELGDLNAFADAHDGIEFVLSARDVPGRNGYGIYPHLKDQRVFAEDVVRFAGEAVMALVGTREAIWALRAAEMPVEWYPLDAITTVEDALRQDAPLVQAAFEGNVLARGKLSRGDARAALADAAHVAHACIQSTFVEHAYIEPEAGYAMRTGDGVTVFATTQTPYMDRDEVADVLGIAPEAVRIVPSACGGGFGGKLDQSVQPLLAVAAWVTGSPVRAVWTRPESMTSSTKRHPACIDARFGCDERGQLVGAHILADFNTGAYSSWGPTVADRVPVHGSGPYFIPNVEATSRAVLTNVMPCGAFRGFGVPQVALAHEAMLDALADKVGIDPLEMRLRNAIRAGQSTPTGQTLEASVGLIECLHAVSEPFREWRAGAEDFNRYGFVEPYRRGVGIACSWYGCGNTSMSNPSTMHVGVSSAGEVTLYSGAVDIGQGANNVMLQVCADALGVAPATIELVTGDTGRTADAGKSSASRQTFVSGKAAALAGADLRAQILRRTNASDAACLSFGEGCIEIHDGNDRHRVDLNDLPPPEHRPPHCNDVLVGMGTFDPPTVPLDENSQGSPYATYGFSVQIAEVQVDLELGTVKVLRMLAAHDVGKAINPTQVEGQIHGGIAQGLGLALMEEYVPGRTDNLHDYLIPTCGDMPQIETVLIEDPEPLGPFGAKGVGEHALISTAPAILGAIDHATGVRITQVPATPDRVRAALVAAGKAPIHDEPGP